MCKKVVSPSGNERIPLIIISSTPRKAGSEDTPWHDRYDPDHGYVKYYGDNKSCKVRPESTDGNSILLELMIHYSSADVEQRRKYAVPVVFFERCSVDGRAKGNAIFHGFGILEDVRLVTQYDKNHEYFANYEFSFCIMSLATENEQFDWRWIIDRCNPSLEPGDTTTYAPQSWKRWINEGNDCLNLVRRSIAGTGLVKQTEQAAANSKLLEKIYHYYDSRKHEFEFLAMDVVVKTIEKSGCKCTPGWITKKSGDGGIDFVLRLDVGDDQLASIKIIVLGQAKCTEIGKPTNGRDVARTVARLKRGWIGAYVTTSYFSKPVQKEIREDEYPLMLINGAKIAEVVEHELIEKKLELNQYLESLTGKYAQMYKIPEDVLYL